MNELSIQTSTHSYFVHIGDNLRFQLQDLIEQDYSSILIITDDKVASLYLDDVLSALKGQRVFQSIIKNGEASKDIRQFYRLQTEAMNYHLDRKSLIIALGGGVVGDLAGFVAATFMRGIDFIQMPTTILAHDSSVGGKVAINHELGKNMIGSFYPPQAVIYDVNTLSSLPEHEVRSGYAELIKEAFIADESFLNQLLNVNIYGLSNNQLRDHLYNGIKIKAEIVEQDEKESNIRKFLNFGHTLAHALETKLGYGKITHGEAVAIGMLFALRLSEQKFNKALSYEAFYSWLKKNNYPLSLYGVKISELLEVMKLDKKAENQHVQMVLLNNVADPKTIELSDQEVLTALEMFEEELKAI